MQQLLIVCVGMSLDFQSKCSQVSGSKAIGFPSSPALPTLSRTLDRIRGVERPSKTTVECVDSPPFFPEFFQFFMNKHFSTCYLVLVDFKSPEIIIFITSSKLSLYVGTRFAEPPPCCNKEPTLNQLFEPLA